MTTQTRIADLVTADYTDASGLVHETEMLRDAISGPQEATELLRRITVGHESD